MPSDLQWIGEPAGGGNPLRIFVFIAVVSLIGDAYYVFGQHRIDAMIILRTLSSVLFLILYFRPSIWAWYLAVAEGPFFLLLYWLLRGIGGLSRPPRPAPASVQLVALVVQLAIVVGFVVWLFVVRERYFRYVTDARSSKT